MKQNNYGSLPTEVGSGRLTRVLLIDDHPVNRHTIRILLGERVELYQAANGREGLDAFAACDFDLVLMDVDMPIMGGVEATRALRIDERRSQRQPVHVVLMTGTQCSDPRSEVLACGADGFLARPITEAALLNVISRMTGADSLNLLSAA